MLKFLFTLLICTVFLQGCATVSVTRGNDGKVKQISTGIMPCKGKIDGCEIDSKLSIFDLNVSGIKSGG